jgi:hypothetical protein
VPSALGGVTRFVGGWSAFADQMVQGFRNTFLPDFMLRPFALSVPPVEAGGLANGLAERPR